MRTQSLHTNSYDEALALPTEEAARRALRTQQIIAFETGVANTVDPLGGAYFIEALTDQLEQGARAYFDAIDRQGGMVEAVKSNFPQREIAEAAYVLQAEIERASERSWVSTASSSSTRSRRSCISPIRGWSKSRSSGCGPIGRRATDRGRRRDRAGAGGRDRSLREPDAEP